MAEGERVRGFQNDEWYECDSCGEELEIGVPHDCPVSGSVVLVEEEEEVRFEGYHPVETLPIKAGDVVRIYKGTTIYATGDRKRRGVIESARTYTVKVDHVLPGREYPGLKVENPRVRWAGSGGYWREADINDVKLIEVDDVEEVDSLTTDLLKVLRSALAEIRAVAAGTKDTSDLDESYAMFDHIEGIARRALEQADA